MAAYFAKPPKGATLNRADPLARSLVLAYALNEKGGLKVYDGAVQSVIGTLTSGPTWGTGPHGACVVFDGTDDYINLPSVPVYLNSVTFSCLVFVTNVTANRTLFYLGGGPGNANIGCEFGRTSGKLSQITGASVVATSNTALSANTWYYLTYVRSGSGTTFDYFFYVNGVSDGGATAVAAPNNSNTNGFLGQGITAGRQLGGRMGGAWYWSRALSAAEVKAHAADPFRMFRRRRVPVPLWGSVAATGNRRRRVICGA